MDGAALNEAAPFPYVLEEFMHRIVPVLIASALFVSSAFAQDTFDTPAEHAVILDHESGVVLFEKNADVPMIPASMTKMMTVYVVFDALKSGALSMDDTFTVSENAWREGGWASGGSTMGLKIGESVSVADLLRGVIVQSGNDACIVLAEGLSGSEEVFADLMTERAQAKGLTSASFKNSTGLDEPEHRISAYDLAQLASLLISDFPELYKMYSEESFTWNGITQSNRNPLLYRFSGADGLKTGHLEVSGYGLVGSAIRDGVRRVTVLNGLEFERQRANEADRFMQAAFSRFDVRTLFSEQPVIATLPVWLGTTDSVDVGTETPVRLGMMRGKSSSYSAQIVPDGALRAPIVKGDEVGRLVITGPGESVAADMPVIALEDVARKGLFSRAFSGVLESIAPSSSTSDVPAS